VIIADDHAMFREGLKILLNLDPNIEITAEASNGIELLEKIQKSACDMVILDLSMPQMSGVQVLKELAKKNPDLKILVLSMHKEIEFLREALNFKIYGYILKDEASNSLVKAIYEVANGRKYFSSGLIEEYAADKNSDKEFKKLLLELLSKRELEIVKLIAEGHSSLEISKKLNISRRTVESHRYRIFEKMKIKKVTDLVKIIIENQIL
jgi:DNA-binding NarL/FixJ family response regulator